MVETKRSENVPVSGPLLMGKVGKLSKLLNRDSLRVCYWMDQQIEVASQHFPWESEWQSKGRELLDSIRMA
jgi:hypothetical protein